LKVNKAYRVELNPNNKQKTYLEKSFGCARFAYNWGLNQRIELYKNHKLAKSLSDASFYEIRRQLEYKTKWYGDKVLYVDRFYPSSKTCSKCGKIKKDLKLSDRIYICECGLKLDRDLNAAINLKNYYIKQNTVSSTVFKACGENIRPNARVQEAISVKQEKSINLALC
jgi:transposase